MLQEDKPIEKVYYTIGEVAAMFNLTVSNIRFWETEFDILMPKKNARGDRFFTKKDIENLRLIHYLLKERGYTISGAKKKLKESKDDIRDRIDMVKSLEKIKSFLVEMKTELDKRTVTEEITEDATEEVVTIESREITHDIVAETDELTATDDLQIETITGLPDMVSETTEETNSALEAEPEHKKSLPPISPDLFSSQPKKEEYLNTGHMPGDGWTY